MKILAVFFLTLTLQGCTSETAFGPCIGAFDDRNPSLTYKVSVWNTFLAIIFIETIFVPIVVIANEAQCPVSKRELKSA